MYVCVCFKISLLISRVDGVYWRLQMLTFQIYLIVHHLREIKRRIQFGKLKSAESIYVSRTSRGS